MKERACGECYACCVHLGIDALHKHPGQACRHLAGQGGATARCGIYDRRPLACATFLCEWRIGAFPDDFRPDISGLLVTVYPDQNGDSTTVSITVVDATKAGTLVDGNLHRLLNMIPFSEFSAVNILNQLTGEAYHIRNQNVFVARITRQEPEITLLEMNETPIGKWY